MPKQCKRRVVKAAIVTFYLCKCGLTIAQELPSMKAMIGVLMIARDVKLVETEIA